MGSRASIEATLELIAAEEEDIVAPNPDKRHRPRADPAAHEPDPAADCAHPPPERRNS
jgi:hypothetical protein